MLDSEGVIIFVLVSCSKDDRALEYLDEIALVDAKMGAFSERDVTIDLCTEARELSIELIILDSIEDKDLVLVTLARELPALRYSEEITLVEAGILMLPEREASIEE